MLLEWLLVAALAIGAVLLLRTSELAARADNAIYDALIARRAPVPSDVVIVAIDEPSLAAIGRWPWPRTVHAAVLERIATAHPAAVGFDVLFVEPGDAAGDRALARAMAAVGTVVLPMTFSVPGADGAPFQPQLPVPPLAHAAAAIGHADFVADRDGILRRVGLAAGGGAERWPQFGECIYRLVRRHRSPVFDRTATTPLPRDRFSIAAPALIPFSGAAGHHRTVSLVSLLRGEVPAELLRGRIVLVGSTASGSGDQYPMPAGAMPGVEVQANVVDALLAHRMIREAGTPVVLAASLVPLALLLLSLLLLPPRINVAVGLVLIVATLLASTLLLWADDLWVPPVAGLAGLMIVYPLWAWRRLEAANAYMLRELTQLRTEPDLVPTRRDEGERRHWYQEPIAQQIGLLHLAVQRVRDLRRFFAESLKGLPDATLVLDPAGRVLVANRAAEALFPGLATSVALRTPPTFAALLRALSPLADLEGGGGEIATGDERVFVVRTAALLDAAESTVGTIVRLTDITAIRLVTRQREDALRLLTHDMRSPQAAILALLDQPAASEAALHDRIAGYARRTLALADNFVLLARAEATAGADEALDLMALLVEAADDQWPLAKARNIRIAVADADDERLTRGDRSLIGRMFGNLVGNAVKYGGRDTIIRCSIEVERDAGGGAVHVCRVADQGIGIPPDQLERVFEPFHRTGTGAIDDPGGAGLGLAFVQTVVRRHGGTVHCTSTVGVGTTFTVRLPAIA